MSKVYELRNAVYFENEIRCISNAAFIGCGKITVVDTNSLDLWPINYGGD
jgi:hypothetical protein